MVLLTLTILQISCSTNVAGNDGGGATETTNGIIYTANGVPAPGAIIRIIDNKNWIEKKENGQSVVLDSFTTDSVGHFSVTIDKSISYNLQVDLFKKHDDSSGEAILINNFSYLAKKDSLNLITLKKDASINGSIENDNDQSVSIDFYGTTYSSKILPNNHFEIPHIAPGVHEIYINNDSNNLKIFQNLSIDEGEELDNYIVDFDLNSIAVDDFEGSSISDETIFPDHNPTMLGNGSFWYYIDSDSNNQDFPFAATINYNPLDESNWLTLNTQIPDTVTNKIISRGIGFTLGNKNSYDLSSTKNVSFYIYPGTGSLRVNFCSSLIDTLQGSDSVQFGHTIQLDTLISNWYEAFTYYEIELDSLNIPSNSAFSKTSYTLSDVLKSINRIEFVFSSKDNSPGQDVWVRLDDIDINYTGPIIFP